MVEPVVSRNQGSVQPQSGKEDAKAQANSSNPANVIGFCTAHSGQGHNPGRLVPGAAKETTSKALSELAALKARAATAEKILAMEARLRQLGTRNELRYFAANEFKALIPCDQIFFHQPGRTDPVGQISAITGIAAPDANSPLLRWLQKEISLHCSVSSKDDDPGLAEEGRPCAPKAFQYRLNTENAPGGNYSFPCVTTVKPGGTSGRSQGAISFLSRRTLEADHLAMAKRLCDTYSHAESRFLPRGLGHLSRKTRPAILLGMLLLMIAMVIPIPLTVLAPLTIIPYQPEIVSAPLTGVIEEVHATPNKPVSPGDLLFAFSRIEWQNQFDLSQKNIAIAEARFKRANQDAFNAGEGRRELAIAKAELALALAERDAAARRLAMVEVRAHKAGVVLFESREKWKGRPVSTGERVMKIADPSQVRFGIDLAVEDSIILSGDASVKVFLDADPLNPINGRVTTTSYAAELSEREQLVFPLRAEAIDGATDQLRIGLKGTAQLYGERVPLWFYLFRKPLSFLRQYFGL